MPKRKHRRRKVDPKAPKKFKTAFMLFAMDERPKIIKDNPDISFTDVGRVLGQRWNNAHPDVRTKYSQMATKDRQRYEEEMASYVPPPIEYIEPKIVKSPTIQRELFQHFHTFVMPIGRIWRKSIPK